MALSHKASKEVIGGIVDHPVKRDHARFRKIVKGKIRENLKEYVSSGDIPIQKGHEKFKIPMPQIEIPRFKFGDNQQQGMGQGNGKEGDPVDGQDGSDGDSPGKGAKASNDEGNKELEVEFSIEELAEILKEELELPKIEPKGKKNLKSLKQKYTSIGTSGPDSLKHFKRTYKEALKRQIILGEYDAVDPRIIPGRQDFRFRSSDHKVEFENSAVVIYMMDVSGSMGEEQKEIVRTQSFWMNLWLKSQYKDINFRYIIHDASAKEVDEETFFRTRESGGTLISSAYKLCQEMIQKDYDPSQWNIYPFHFSDGDNWSHEDTKLCLDLLDQVLLPVSNMFCYGQVESRYGSGQFFKDLELKYSSQHEKIILGQIKGKGEILPCIKKFLGKGK